MSQRTTTNGQAQVGRALWRGFAFLGLFCLLLALAGHPRPAAAAGPWYVSTSGNDTNSCTDLAHPCRTIGGALGKAASGDTIVVSGGLYNEHLVIGKDIHINGSSTTLTIIDGMSNGRVVDVTSGFNVTLSALTIQNGHVTGPAAGGTGIWNRDNVRSPLDAFKVIGKAVFVLYPFDFFGEVPVLNY